MLIVYVKMATIARRLANVNFYKVIYAQTKTQHWQRSFSLFSSSLYRSTVPTHQASEQHDVKNDAAAGAADVKLSDSCVKQFHKMNEPDSYLRVVVEGGGCSGFQYLFELDNTVKEDDKVFERDGARVVVDADTLEFLRGSTIDYEEELIRSAFRVQSNPQAEQGCSCGSSFSLKL